MGTIQRVISWSAPHCIPDARLQRPHRHAPDWLTRVRSDIRFERFSVGVLVGFAGLDPEQWNARGAAQVSMA